MIAAVLHPDGEAPGAHGPHYVALEPDAGWKEGGADQIYLHETAIREVREDGVVLILTRSQVQTQGRADPPAGFSRDR